MITIGSGYGRGLSTHVKTDDGAYRDFPSQHLADVTSAEIFRRARFELQGCSALHQAVPYLDRWWRSPNCADRAAAPNSFTISTSAQQFSA
jgi:hypothetical protein